MENSQKVMAAIDATYQKASADLLQDLEKNNDELYRKIFDKVSISNDQFFEQALANLTELSKKKIEEHEEFFRSKFKEFEDFIQQKKEQNVKELEDYKKAKIESFNTELSTTMKRILHDNIPNFITSSDHEKLIIQAIEKAKKDGFFDSL